MTRRRNLWAIIALGAFIALVLFLYPEWFAVHPRDPGLTVSLGRAWFLNPPPPPKSFEGMQVTKSAGRFLEPPAALAISVLICLAIVIQPKATSLPPPP